MFAHTASVSQSSLKWPAPSSAPRTTTVKSEGRDRRKLLIISAALAAVVLLVAGGIYLVRSSRNAPGAPPAPSQPTVEAQPTWQSIADARVARDAVAAGTRATTPRSTAGKAVKTCRFRCSTRWP
jgi:hypothetical protein